MQLEHEVTTGAELEGRTMRWQELGERIVLVHAAITIDDAEWNTYAALTLNRRPVGTLVLVPPGCPGPNADQRRSLSDAVKRAGEPPIAIITHSPLHRHMITAMNWLSGGSMRAFSPDEIDAACEYGGFTGGAKAEALALAGRFTRQLGIAMHFPHLR